MSRVLVYNHFYGTRIVISRYIIGQRYDFFLVFEAVSVASLISITDVSSAFTSWLAGVFDFLSLETAIKTYLLGAPSILSELASQIRQGLVISSYIQPEVYIFE